MTRQEIEKILNDNGWKEIFNSGRWNKDIRFIDLYPLEIDYVVEKDDIIIVSLFSRYDNIHYEKTSFYNRIVYGNMYFEL